MKNWVFLFVSASFVVTFDKFCGTREKQSSKLVVFPLICCNFAKVFIGVAVLAAMKRESGANPEQNPLL